MKMAKMGFFFLWMFLPALLGVVFGDGTETILGQKNIRTTLVTWSAASGNWSSKTRLLFLGNSVYVDTSTTGQANSWKRIDNTADSCSNPIPLALDSNGATRPIWLYEVFETVRGVDGDSTSHTYRVQTRERVYDNAIKSLRWTPWTRRGANNGYVDVTVQDSLLFGNAASTSKTSMYALGFYLGSWGRLCPDDNVATANAAGDSVFADSLQHFAR